MAEAIAALSLAANIIQFIDFGGKVLSGGVKLYKKGRGGSLDEINDTKLITEALKRLMGGLNRPLEHSNSNREGNGFSQTEVDLQNLAAHCTDIANELLQAIKDVELGRKAGKRDAFWAALKNVLSQGKIEKIRQRLDRFRQEIITHILTCFRYYGLVSLEQKSPLLIIFRDEVKQQHSVLEIVRGSTESFGTKFLEFMEQSNKWQEGYTEDRERLKTEIISAIHDLGNSEKQHCTNLGTQQNAVKGKLLSLLKFEEIEDRHERIAKAYEKTFQWIFQTPAMEESEEGSEGTSEETLGKEFRDSRWTNFTQWLGSPSSLYWITGKAGSGKSTLIKYIAQDSRTQKYLRIWAPEKKVIIAPYFFWNSGTSMQMSQQGLLRSLLYNILSSCPLLTASLFPERHEAHHLFGDDPTPLTEAELRKAFALLKNVDPSIAKFCFFIDGLDEFNGDHSNLVKFVKDLSEGQNVKLCVSSRPWLVFEDAFKTRPSLMVQNLTYPDIIYFIKSKFSNDRGFIELRERETQYADKLFEDIAHKADGVFLWVHLVVNSLLAGFSNGDRVSDLQKRLSLLPPDLEKLYQKILDNLDPFYLEHASQFFELVRKSQEPPSLLCMSLADEELGAVLERRIVPFSNEEITNRMNVMKRRLNSRCKGLLEVGSGRGGLDEVLHLDSASDGQHLSNSTVQYLHRTVKDFLEDPKNWNRLIQSRNEEYDSSFAMAKSFLGQLKGIVQIPFSFKIFHKLVGGCLFYTKLVRKVHDADAIMILDELDRTAGQLAAYVDPTTKSQFLGDRYIIASRELSSPDQLHQMIAARRSCILELHWTSLFYSSLTIKPGFSFLSFATRLGFHGYVASKIQPGCLLVQDNNIWPLLLDALLDVQEDHTLNLYRPFPDSPFPDQNMVKLLLDNGADPNRIIPSKNITLWEYFLWYAQNERPSIVSKLHPWLDLVPLFLAYGANRQAITASKYANGKSKSIHDIWNRVEIGEVLGGFLRSRIAQKGGWGWNSSPACDISEADIALIKSSRLSLSKYNIRHPLVQQRLIR